MDGMFFEMENVLFDATLWRRWMCQLLWRLGLDFRYEAFWSDWERGYEGAVHRGECEFYPAFREFLRSRGLARAMIEELEMAGRTQAMVLESQLRPWPGVAATLTRLRQTSIRMGVFADCDLSSAEIRLRLARIGLDGYFQTIVASRDWGRTKADPQLFRTALDSLGTAEANTALVGCREADLQAAKTCGWLTIACHAGPHIAADWRMNRFEELLRLAVPAPRQRAA